MNPDAPDPNPWLLAKNSTWDEFIARYKSEMATWAPPGAQTAIWGAVGNPDPEARVKILRRLLDDGADSSVSYAGVNLLHSLFSQQEHDFPAEAELLQRILDGGADINQKSPRFGVPLKSLLENYALRDEDLGPFYDVIFAQRASIGMCWCRSRVARRRGRFVSTWMVLLRSCRGWLGGCMSTRPVTRRRAAMSLVPGSVR